MFKINKVSFVNIVSEYYYFLIPLASIFLIYFTSLSFGFRNFDEDVIIKDFHTNKTFAEYFEKYLLINLSGITNAYGFTFSGIQNVHFCPLERPLFYFINYLFNANPFLFHAWSLFLHIVVSLFVCLLIFNLTKNKNVALFSTLLWGIHPINIEAVVWATNWPALVGAGFYFGTLYLISKKITEAFKFSNGFIILVSFLTLTQILIIEHCVTLPLIIFLMVYYLTKQKSSTSPFIDSLKISAIPFAITLIYLLARMFLISNPTLHNESNINNLIERILYFTPQVFLHNLKLLFFPLKLSIDQIDQLQLDKTFLGGYNLFCIILLIAFLAIAVVFGRKKPLLSLCMLAYIIAISPFLQIIPLYSIIAERYSYFSSSFLILGLVIIIQLLLHNKNKLIISALILLSTLYGIRTLARIQDWQSSTKLFLSTINTSKSLYKKGIWTYNLALSSEDEAQEKELLILSSNLLNIFATNYSEKETNSVLKQYELDGNSIKAKANLRIAKINELIGNYDLIIRHLNQALEVSNLNSQIKGEIYKGLATYYFQNKQYNQAIEFYKKSDLISASPTIDYAIAINYLKLNDLVNYEKYLNKATSIISINNTKPFTTYGQFLELNKGDHENAIKNYKIATLLENNPEPYILISTLYLKQKDIKNARKYIKRGLHSFPSNPLLTYLNGSLLINKGKTEEGITELKKVVENNNASIETRTEAGNILVILFLNKSDYQNAKKYNDLVLTIDPGNKEALINKTRF